jgi:hypothetical protein
MSNITRTMFQAAAGASGGGEGYFGVVFSDYNAIEDQDYNPYLWIDDTNDSSIYMSYIQRDSSSEQGATFAKITAGGNVEYARELRVAGRPIEQTMQYDPGTATWTTIADYLSGFKFFKINESSITSNPSEVAREAYDASNNRLGQPSRFSFSRKGSQSIICGVTTFTGSKPMYAKIDHNGSNFDVVREGTGDSLSTIFSTYCDPYGSNQMINFFYRDGYHQVSRTDLSYSNLSQNDAAKKVTFGLSTGQINVSYLRASSVYYKSGTPFHFMTGADSGLVTYDRAYFTYGSAPNCTDEYRLASSSINAYPTAITGVVDSGYNVIAIYIAISTTPFNTSPTQYLYKIDTTGTPSISECLRIDNAGSGFTYPGVIRKLYYDNQYDAVVALGFAGNGSNPDAFMFRIAGDLSTSGSGSFSWASVTPPHTLTKLSESQATESGIWGNSTSNGSDSSGTATNTIISNNNYGTSSVSF